VTSIRSLPAPTEAELDVLRVLWDRGAATVREVHEAVAAAKPVGYTTVLKQMQVMRRKGLVRRSERFRSHVYEAAQPRSDVQQHLVRTLLRQAFGGSARSLLQSALGRRKVSPKELAEIQTLLDEMGARRP
jgi:BlaI family penicillinase repressor